MGPVAWVRCHVSDVWIPRPENDGEGAKLLTLEFCLDCVICVITCDPEMFLFKIL